jgi:hypothetical protein
MKISDHLYDEGKINQLSDFIAADVYGLINDREIGTLAHIGVLHDGVSTGEYLTAAARALGKIHQKILDDLESHLESLT